MFANTGNQRISPTTLKWRQLHSESRHGEFKTGIKTLY